MKPPRFLSVVAPLFLAPLSVFAADKTPIAIDAIERGEPVDFARDLAPFLNENCLACHAGKTLKGQLNMESPELMLKGGDSGPAIVPGKGQESLVLQAAAHLDPDLLMPPADNKAKARDLSPQQLGLLKLWIDQGAKPSKKVARVLQWQPIPGELNAILAVAMSADGQFAACARSNRLSIYHLPSGRLLADQIANRDQINALAFSPDGTVLASAAYREVTLFGLSKGALRNSCANTDPILAVSADGKFFATADAEGTVKIFESAGGTQLKSFKAGAAALNAIAFSPDAARIACAGRDKSLSLWNAADATQLAGIQAPDEISALTWLAGSGQLASGGADQPIRIWSETLAPLKEFTGQSAPIVRLGWLPGEPGRLVSAGHDGMVRIWDVEKAQSLLEINQGAPLTAMAIRPDGNRLATASANGIVKLWDAAGKNLGDLKGNRYEAELAQSADRRLQIAVRDVAYRKAAQEATGKLLVASQDRVKKAEEAIPPRQKELADKDKESGDAAAAQGAAELALAEAESALKKAVETLELADKAAQQAKADAEALKAAAPPEPAAIEKGAADAAARAQDAAKAKAQRDQLEAQRKQAADKIEPTKKKTAAAAEALAKSRQAADVAAAELTLGRAEEQKLVAATAQAKAAVETAETARLKADEALQAAKKTIEAAALPVLALAFSPDNTTLASAGEDKLIRTWSAGNGSPFDVIEGSPAPVEALCFGAGGELLAALRDHSLQCRDITPRWKSERVIGSDAAGSPFADRVCALAFSADGKWLATGGGEPSRAGEIKIWETATGALLKDFPNVHSDSVLALEFSPDGGFLASGAADKFARVVELASGKVTCAFEGHSHHVLSLSWNPDGHTLVTGGADNLVKVWDFPSGERKKNIEGYEKEITSVRYVGVGDQILTGSGDPKIRLVAPDGKDIRAFAGATDFIQGVAATADGRWVMAGGQDGVLRIWKTADGERLLSFPSAP